MKINFGVSDKKNNPDVDKGVKLGYAPAKRVGYRWRWYLLLALFVIPLLVIAWLIAKPHIFILSEGVITTDPIQLKAPYAAHVKAVNVGRGETVAKNTSLVQLASEELTVEIRKIEEVLATLSSGGESYNERILQQLEKQINVAEQGVSDQEEFLAIYQDFKRSGVIPTHEMAVILRSVTESKITYESAKANRLQVQQELKESSVAGTVTQRRQELERQLASLKARQEKLNIHSLKEGKVIDVLVKPGEYVQDNQTVALVSGNKEPVIFAYLEAKYFEYTKVGNKATVELPNGDEIRAKVTEPPQLTQKLPPVLVGPFDNKTAVLKVTLEPDSALSTAIEGLPVEIYFDYW
ncbi:HlyD family secretion protein [Idiomarina sp. UBA4520]|uniref:HlyD family secretion protein n=1 Tax=Idiomarina sp. UBA4520 TaxID=1946647 RepID=UPI000C468AAB|nr:MULTISPECIES: HlyD family secretion protein [unclassified Idiomarina]MBF38668.1 hypothetical protein [Idiomarinaceae bacterium]|tara:strand:- start:31267 stop:32319 length:1053 start_codon:yes stop_codon:yes gene_type:complete